MTKTRRRNVDFLVHEDRHSISGRHGYDDYLERRAMIRGAWFFAGCYVILCLLCIIRVFLMSNG